MDGKGVSKNIGFGWLTRLLTIYMMLQKIFKVEKNYESLFNNVRIALAPKATP